MGNLATNVLIRRAIEGPQLVLTWTNPDDAGLSDIEIRRGTNGFPESITDGISVYVDVSPTPSADGAFADVAVDGQVTYYYTIFAKVTAVWYHDYTTQKREFPLDSREFHLRLWNALPQIYRSKDTETLQKALLAQTVDNEEWNYWEDQIEKYGQLYRFLKVFGVPFGIARELVKYFEVFYDIYNVRDDLLPYLANLIGFELFGGMSLQRQRFLIANAVELYRIRGTMDGAEQFAESNFLAEIQFVEFRNNILESNNVDLISVSDDPIVLNNWNSPYNTIDYVVDGSPGAQWSYRTIGLFFDDCLRSHITQEMLDIAEDYFQFYLPGTGAWWAFDHWNTLWEDQFADFLNWTETDPGGKLAPVGGKAVFNVASGAGTFASSLNRAPGLSAGTEFAVDLILDNITWPTSAVGPGRPLIRLQVDWGIHYAGILILLRSTGEGRFLFGWSNSGGSGTQIIDFATPPSECRLRVERGPNGLVRGIYQIGGIREVLHQVLHSDYIPAPSDVNILWSTTNPTGNFHTESEWFRQWEANVGNTWNQIHP